MLLQAANRTANPRYRTKPLAGSAEEPVAAETSIGIGTDSLTAGQSAADNQQAGSSMPQAPVAGPTLLAEVHRPQGQASSSDSSPLRG